MVMAHHMRNLVEHPYIVGDRTISFAGQCDAPAPLPIDGLTEMVAPSHINILPKAINRIGSPWGRQADSFSSMPIFERAGIFFLGSFLNLMSSIQRQAFSFLSAPLPTVFVPTINTLP